MSLVTVAVLALGTVAFVVPLVAAWTADSRAYHRASARHRR